MKSKLLFWFSCLFVCAFTFGQDNCGTPFKTFADTEPKSFSSLRGYCLNVYFHIVRNNNGQGGIHPNHLDGIINHLNAIFEEHNISFVKMEVDFIDNSDYVNLAENEYGLLTNTNRFEYALNYYIVESMWGSVEGSAYIRSNALVISRNSVMTMVSPHEVGHSLGLYHTYQGTASGTSGCPEAIDGSNCLSCGDRICDTPADANIGASGGYNPDMLNIMSDYNNRQHFTEGQGSKMKSNISTFPALAKMISNSCSAPNIFGSTLVCSSNNITFVAQNIPSPITWNVSSNLQIVNSTPYSITVSIPHNNIRDLGFVEASHTSLLSVRKNLWLGTPNTQGVWMTYDNQIIDNLNLLEVEAVSNKRFGLIKSDLFTPSYGIDTVFSWEAPSEWNPSTQIGGNNSFQPLTGPTGSNGFVSVEIKNDCGSSGVLTAYVEVGNTGSSSKNISTYPNPVKNTLFIETKNSNYFNKTIKLIDLFGNLKVEQNYNAELASIDLSHIPAGIYILKVATDEGVVTKQIIKN